MKRLFYLCSMLLIPILAFGQLKTIELLENIGTNYDQILLENKPTKSMPTTNEFQPFNVKNIDFPDLIVINNGLKSGPLNEYNLPLFIEGKLINNQKGLTIEQQALAYLDAASPLMKMKNVQESFKLISMVKDDLGLNHVKFKQMFKGVQVYGAEIIIHGDEAGFDFLNGVYFADVFLENVVPNITKDKADIIVQSDLGELTEYDFEIDNLLPHERVKSSLVIYKEEQIGYKLVYKHTIYKNLAERWEYFTDAQNGQIIEKFPSLCKFHHFGKNHNSTCFKMTDESIQEDPLDGKATAVARDLFNINRQINTYEVSNQFYMIDGARDIFSNQSVMPNSPVGTIWTIDAFNTSPAKNNFKYDHIKSNNNVWTSTPTGVSAHYNGGKAFEYFRIVHNRSSINGSGGNIISMINVSDEDGSSMGNAFWNGAAMFYGNGDNAFLPLARGLDVAGHEMSHGVIQSTANLEYKNESGALNESFADVFGAMIDRDDWLIGEDVVRPAAFPSGALRSLSNPHNGAPTNDYNKGWQPKHYNERFTGTANNGGVHINSGIPNHAFFLFATAVGKEKAEKVYYRALNLYLTKSSKFVDCRVAVVKAAGDLYGQTEVNAARKAFTDVGILGDNGGSYENDVQINPGDEFLLFTNANRVGLFITRPDGTPLSFANPLSNKTLISKPSISDDGTEIVFIGSENKMHYIRINWSTGQKQESILSNDPIWRNAIISKDGSKIAALTQEENNQIFVYHFGAIVTSSSFDLYNPTFTNGISTGDVLYADAMEFDITGEYIMYDAENEISSNTSGTINYWDVGFVKVWNNASNSFSLGEVEKLFASLPQNVSVGNPAFSKNSPYIIALDFIEEDDYSILGVNIERGDVSLIFDNNVLAYPNYSSKDNQLVFDNRGQSSLNVGIIDLQNSKIDPKPNSAFLYLNGRRWATWFSNGKRILSSNEEVLLEDKSLWLFPNPTSQNVSINFVANTVAQGKVSVYDFSGRVVKTEDLSTNIGANSMSLDLSTCENGFYIVQVALGNEVLTTKLIKIGE